jgi:hypothetical protein
MDLETIIIAVVSILICCLPFWLMIRNRKKNEKRMICELAAQIGKTNLRLSKFDLTPSFLIGVAEQDNELYFLRKSTKGDQFISINLNEYQACELIKVENTESAITFKTIQAISLRLIPVEKHREVLLISLYNAEETGALAGELQLSIDWSQYLTMKLSRNNI